MAGLISQQPAPDPNAPQPGADPNAQPAPGGEQPPAPQGPPIGDAPVDDETVKKFIANCMDVVTASLKQLVGLVQQTEDKAAALAQATVQTVIRVEDSYEEHGGTLSLQLTLQAGAETLSDIAQAVGQAGIHDYTDDEIERSFLRAVDQYRMIRAKQGRIDQKAALQKVQELKQAEANGTLEKDYPGLGEFAKKGEKLEAEVKAQAGQNPAAEAGEATPDAETPADEAEEGADTSNDFPPEMLAKREGKVAPKKGGK